ncbi:MAG: YbaB/EbfC family nucleoid-associated protein [Gammaproteobacteria bacterium]|nr:YbaB/EbfC family nucleoid-associated protein [Gammaproteobacteria bacterium]
MKGGLGSLMQQAQQLQENMQKAREELALMQVTGQAGGGMVTVVMTGRHEVRRVNIDGRLMGDDQGMLEDLITAAVNDAVNRVETATRERFSGLTAGLALPDGMQLPF